MPSSVAACFSAGSIRADIRVIVFALGLLVTRPKRGSLTLKFGRLAAGNPMHLNFILGPTLVRHNVLLFSTARQKITGLSRHLKPDSCIKIQKAVRSLWKVRYWTAFKWPGSLSNYSYYEYYFKLLRILLIFV